VAYPDDLLGEDEHVVIHKHPHWKMLLLPVLVFLVTIGLGAFLAALASQASWREAAWIVIAVACLVPIARYCVSPLVRWRTTHFVITSQRVMSREGVFSRTGTDIPMSRINSVQFRHGLVDRMLGCGTLIIESASDEPLEFDDIPDVERVHTLLYREVNDDPDDDFHPGARHGGRR
jgi:uncharacterized membrane protein YdbT with pleckstrin-like domain